MKNDKSNHEYARTLLLNQIVEMGLQWHEEHHWEMFDMSCKLKANSDTVWHQIFG